MSDKQLYLLVIASPLSLLLVKCLLFDQNKLTELRKIYNLYQGLFASC